jgi:hypothetical protein
MQMNAASAYVPERFFSSVERQKLFRSWAATRSGVSPPSGVPYGIPVLITRTGT